jgi:hypothetical protein
VACFITFSKPRCTTFTLCRHDNFRLLRTYLVANRLPNFSALMDPPNSKEAWSRPWAVWRKPSRMFVIFCHPRGTDLGDRDLRGSNSYSRSAFRQLVKSTLSEIPSLSKCLPQLSCKVQIVQNQSANLGRAKTCPCTHVIP